MFSKGLETEERFIKMLGKSFIRKATRMEDIYQHWDVLTSEGKVDVKGMKKVNRKDSKVDPDMHFYEFKNVKGDNGWGVPNDVTRMIAFEVKDGFILVDPEQVFTKIMARCSGYGYGYFQFRDRKKYGRDDLFTKVPVSYLRENSCGFVNKKGIKVDHRTYN